MYISEYRTLDIFNASKFDIYRNIELSIYIYRIESFDIYGNIEKYTFQNKKKTVFCDTPIARITGYIRSHAKYSYTAVRLRGERKSEAAKFLEGDVYIWEIHEK